MVLLIAGGYFTSERPTDSGKPTLATDEPKATVPRSWQ
jgi:hypothetical protein